MPNVHYSATARTVFIDEGSRSTTIELPEGLDVEEVLTVIQSDTLRHIIAALIEEGGRSD